jgi:hypothetical protein
MDPATILILLGAFYAIKSGVKGVKLARAAASRASVPASGGKSGRKAGGGMPSWLTNQRHTGGGWWAGEVRHGFPVFRAGVREGWTRHQTAMAQRQAAVAKTRADHTAKQQTYRQERDAHRQRLEDIERQERERKAAENAAAAKAARAAAPATPAVPAPRKPGHPVMAPPPGPGRGSQPAARPVNTPQSGCSDPGCTCHRPAPPPISPADWLDDPAATCSDPDCTYCGTAATKPEGVPPAGATTTTTTGGNMSDTSYEMTQETCDKIAAALEAAMNDQELAAAEQLCDGLAADLVDDTETLGHAGDLVSAIQAVKAAMATAMEQVAALKASHERNHGAAHEAAQATGHMAQREHHMAG